jgi:hypothetical protein
MKIGIVIAISLIVGLLLMASAESEISPEIETELTVPVGSIIMYNGSQDDFTQWGDLISDMRFHICDGTNYTVNLKGRFIVSADFEDNEYDEVGETGGSSSVTLTLNEIPSHRHTYADWYPAFRTYNAINGATNLCDAIAIRNTNTGYSGGGQAHENRPQFTVVIFIQRMS